MHVANMKTSYENVPAYGCGWHRDRGASVCGNATRRPVEEVNAAVLGWIRDAVLREDVLAEVLRELRERLEARAKSVTTEGPAIEAQARQLRAEVTRLATAIATSSTKSDALVKALDERERRLRDLDARLRAMKAAPSAVSLEVRRLEREARSRLEGLRELVARQPEAARGMLEAFFSEPVKCRPVETAKGRRLELVGLGDVGALISTDGVPSGDRAVLNVPMRLVA